MTIYKGHWDQLEPNPKFPDQEPTEYIRASAGTQEEIRDKLDTWCNDITRKAEELAEAIKEEDGGSIAQAREVAWAELDAMLQQAGGTEPIGVDPQVYTTKKIISVCKKELVAQQKNGKLKDVKRSLVDRHNWQVVAWAQAKYGIESQEDITTKHLDWIEDRVVDVQNIVPTAAPRSQRVLNSIFGE
jgi:hypothetical protein